MAESVSSCDTSFEVDDTFHLINAETGNTWTRQRDDEVIEASDAPHSGIHPAHDVSDAMEAVETSPDDLVEFTEKTATSSFWSFIGNSRLQQRHLHEDVQHLPPSTPSERHELSPLSPTSRMNGADSMSPSHGKAQKEDSMQECEEMLSRLNPSAPEEDVISVVHTQWHQSDQGDGERESDPTQALTFPEGISDRPAMGAVGSGDDGSNPSTTPQTLTERLFMQNAILRAQLAEADRNNVQYLILQEKTAEELKNMRETMMAVLYDEEGTTNSFNEDLFQHNPLHEQGLFERLLNMVGGIQIAAPFLPQRHPRRYGRRPNKATPLSQEEYAALEWKRNFANAKWHAHNGRAEMAMEMLLLAITSEDFDAWDTLLVNDDGWNRLRGVARQRWDSLVAAKVTELLRRGVNGRSQEQPREEEEEEQSDAEDILLSRQRTLFRPNLLVSFIGRMCCRYAEEKTRYEAIIRGVTTPGTSPQGVIPQASHNFLVAEIEDLLAVSLCAFPGNVELLYLMASLRGLQGRTEDSLGLLRHVLSTDPSCLLSQFFPRNTSRPTTSAVGT